MSGEGLDSQIEDTAFPGPEIGAARYGKDGLVGGVVRPEGRRFLGHIDPEFTDDGLGGLETDRGDFHQALARIGHVHGHGRDQRSHGQDRGVRRLDVPGPAAQRESLSGEMGAVVLADLNLFAAHGSTHENGDVRRAIGTLGIRIDHIPVIRPVGKVGNLTAGVTGLGFVNDEGPVGAEGRRAGRRMEQGETVSVIPQGMDTVIDRTRVGRRGIDLERSFCPMRRLRVLHGGALGKDECQGRQCNTI